MQPTSIVIFGATGNLARKKLFPALLELYKDGNLPVKTSIFAIGRRPYSTEEFLAQLELPEENTEFVSRIRYHHMDFANHGEYEGLRQHLEEVEIAEEACGNRLFYLSVPPSSYKDIMGAIAVSGIYEKREGFWSRIIIEKPFGTDQTTAHALDEYLQEMFPEEEVYRVDHFLGKDTIQNILAFRFANRLFEPVWNKENIDHIQITVAESMSVEGRGAYYEEAGAIKDMIQNHVLQLCTFLLMDEPASFTFNTLSDAKMSVLRSMRAIPEKTVYGQYQGYSQEKGVGKGSVTETYAMTTFELHHERWQGVPIYVRTGKSLPERVTEVTIQFKESTTGLFHAPPKEVLTNVLSFRIQPEEGVFLQMAVKEPGHNLTVHPAIMSFCYNTAFKSRLPDAYERILNDIVKGDRTLSLRNDTIEESWRIIDELLGARTGQPEIYQPGSWGPERAEAIMQADGHQWFVQDQVICNGIIVK